MKNFTKIFFAILFAFTQSFTAQAQTPSAISACSDFVSGPTAWPYVLVATTVADGASSQGAQTFTMNVTSLPTGGANFRVYKTTANGSDFFGPAIALVLGSNSITVPAVTFDRAVKFQFSSGDPEFDALSLNGVASTCVAPPPTSLISACSEFDAGPTAWPYVLVATTVADGAPSQELQTFFMNVTSLPTGGADVRVYKTTANGSDFFGPAIALTLGANIISVPAVSFDRTVKFQFSSGDPEFNALSVNGTASSCVDFPLVSLSLQGIIDFTVPGGGNAGKAIHVVALDDIPDLSVYGIGVANNGGGTDGLEYIFDAIAVSAGDDILIARDVAVMTTYFDACATSFEHILDATVQNGGLSSSAISQNGDDAIELFLNGSVIETFGEVDVDGSGDPWEYLDSWAYKTNLGTTGSFVLADWGFGAVNCTDGSTTIYDASCFYPMCAPSPITYTLNMYDSYNDGWDGASWSATDDVSGAVYGPYTITYSQGGFNTASFTVVGVSCLSISMGGGSYASEHTWTLMSGDTILSAGDPYNGTLGSCISGCTDQSATNYNPLATLNDGSCIFPPCGAPAPTHETFSTSVLPLGTCVPNQWNVSATTGSGWVFSGTPGYSATYNGRSTGTYTWIDFSGTDVDPVLEVEHIDVSALTTSALFFDYFSDLGTYACASNNTLHVEAFDGTTWNSVAILQLNATGWNTYGYVLTGFENGTNVQLRFRGESNGLFCDYYNDLLLDDVKIEEAVYGCTDASFDNYDAAANFDDGSCANTYTLVMADSWNDGWDGSTWTATSTTTGAVFGPYTISYFQGGSNTETFSSADPCFTVVMGGGSYLSEHTWSLLDANSDTIIFGGDPYVGSFGGGCIPGCTDPVSFDYDPSATLEDGSCTYPCIDTDSTESFETSLGAWEQDATDDIDWTWKTGATGSFGTGPTSAFDGAYYLYTESSGYYLKTANLTLPCVDPTAWTEASMAFAYHMYGATTGTLSVDASDDNGATWTTLWTLSGDQGNQWNEASVNLSGYTSQIDLRIQAVTGTSFTSDIAIDLTRLQENIGGCQDTNATNYDASALLDDGSCTYTMGCTNPYADNYDPLAYLDDGSCTYANCASVTLDMADSFGDGWDGASFVITDTNGYVYMDATILSGSTGTATACLPQGACLTLTMGGGSYASEHSWTLTDDASATVILSGADPYTGTLCVPYTGCTDPLASNYDSTSLVDDGSCLYATTFTVDMNCEPAGSFGYVHLESPEFGWCGGCVPMTDADGDGVWSVTVDLDLGNFEYKYAVDGFAGQENLIDDMVAGASCAPVTDYFSYANRLVAVAAGLTTADTYGSCDACVLGCTDPLANNYDATATTDDGSCLFTATFNVDMNCEDPTTYSTVHLESAYFGCFTGCTQMSDPEMDGIYSVTVDIPGGDFVYFYSIDNNSSREDLVDDMVSGETCAPVTDYFSYANRLVTATSGINTSDTYGSCIACIAGCTDPLANNYDSTMTTDDGSCEYDVTFTVDMTCSGLTPTTLAATGFLDNWSGNTYLLTDADGDGIWEGTHSVTDNFVYMYVVDVWADSEFAGLFNEMLNGTNSCAPYTDNISYAYRQAAANSTTTDIYGQCSICPPGCTDPAASNYNSNAQIDDGSCVYATTFNVDMNCEPVGSFGYVHLESPVFGWCGGCVPMTDPDGDGVHSVTVDLPLGNFEYKYAVDSWAGQEDLVDDMQNGASCAPVTDYFSYANRLVDVSAGTVLDDTYGSCDICDQVNGCTDAGAINYDAFATDDDGSCLFSTTFNVDMNCEPAGSFGYVHLESPSFGWCGGCVPMTDPDGDGVHSVTVDLPAGNFEYKYAVDGWAGQEDLIDDMVGGASCAPVTDYFSYANRLLDVNKQVNVGNELVSDGDFSNGGSGWGYEYAWYISGGTANLFSSGYLGADLYQYGAITAGVEYILSFDIIVNSGSLNVGNSSILQNIDSTGHYEIIFTASSDRFNFLGSDSSLNDIQLDNVSIYANGFDSSPVSDDTYGSCSECLLGCTDSLAFNYSDSAMVDDGSCLYGYNCPAPYPIGLSSSDIYAEMATIHWTDANSGSCRVEKYFVRYREVGTLNWTTKSAGAGSGLCNVGLPNTSKVLRGLMPSTTYEFKMKAFYCGGGESGYSFSDQFTTQDACPEMDTLMVETFSANDSKARFTWTETGPYTFARVALRVNTVGSNWQTAGGFGVFYPTYSVNKFGLQSGTEYRAQGRTFCDVNVTSYRSDWTSPITWTQPGVAPIRLDGGSIINNLEVYPNPSKDIFNVSFVSEEVQNLEVRVLNMVGELVYTEGLEQFVGEYTKSINMSKYTKGIYFLEITTNNGVVNKKIVLQ